MIVEGLTCRRGNETLRVREVWAENLEHEMEIIRDIVDDYPYIAMDTEFPGVVCRPVGPFKNSGEYHYQTLRYGLSQVGCSQDRPSPRCAHDDARNSTGQASRLQAKWTFTGEFPVMYRINVDVLKLIQLGLTFTDKTGKLPKYKGELCVWQFNFR